MSPARKKGTGTRRARVKRAAKRGGRSPERARAAGATKARPAGGRTAAASAAKDGARPRLEIVARPAARRRRARVPAGVTEFSGAKAGASAKDLALFGLERGRVAVWAAFQGLTAGAASRPIAAGKWSVRQIALHLAFWDREILTRYLEPAAARNQRAGIRRSDLESRNTAGVEAHQHLDWEGARRLLQTAREDLWDALESIPAEPAEVWSPEHAVGELVEELTTHDRHHAEAIKRWRAETKA